tara:strand:+ start:159 stop:1373 length:1215 start_codon:yes stop_codon:yes gene_type:complete
MNNIFYCKKCLYPSSAVNLNFDKNGVCRGCIITEKYRKNSSKIDWDNRKKKFEVILNESLNKKIKSNYDCLIPVSGGKDSYYQTHIICKEYNLKPLLVTYHGNNFLPEGDYNRDRMKEVFDADHIVWGPSVDILKKLNRAAFYKMGDMNWQNHTGIMSAPVQISVMFKIPLMIWGESPFETYGMFEPDDYIEFTKRFRDEHDMRGFDIKDFVNSDSKNAISEKDMVWAKYPSDKEILNVGLRGIHIGNYFKWSGYENYMLAKKKYSWKERKTPFERTYRSYSNLDDRYENGIHDLMKFVKFGYGRATDHASKDIRSSLISREEGVKMVKKYDAVVSSDLDYWLNYVDMSKDEFWAVADTFRDPNVWWIENKKWFKRNLWDEGSSYGEVNLSDEQINKFNSLRKL